MCTYVYVFFLYCINNCYAVVRQTSMLFIDYKDFVFYVLYVYFLSGMKELGGWHGTIRWD